MKLRVWAASAACLLVFSASATAFADDSITVRLKNGGEVRGELVERVPNEKIVLKLATGEIRTIPWAKLAPVETTPPVKPEAVKPEPAKPSAAKVEQGEAEESAPEPPPTPKPKMRRAPVPDPVSNDAQVHIDSNYEKTALYRVTGVSSGTAWGSRGSVSVSLEHADRVCSSPCDTEVPAGEEYFIDAPGMTKSDKFNLSLGGKNLKVSGGSAALRGLGLYGGMGVGGGLLLGGVMLTVLGSSSQSAPDSLKTMGIVSASTGAFLLIGGLVLFFTNETSVKDGEGKTVARPSKPLRLAASGFAF
jgi:hypothetical protein